MSQTLERVKLASAKAEEDHAKLMEEKQAIIDSKRSEKEDIELRIQSLRNANSEERVESMRLDETSEAVNALRDQLKEVRDADMDVVRNANLEVEEAKKRLEEIEKEETSVRDVVESLKQELENVKRDIAVFKGDDDLEGEKLRAELDHSKQQVQEAIKEKTKAKNHLKEMDSKIGEMSLKAEKARKKEKETKTKVETLWREAQHSELAMREAEAKLEIAQREVQEAKEAKELADDQIRSSSTKDDVADDTNLTSDFDSDTPAHQNSTIKLTTQDFEALSRKVEEATTAADTKVATIMDQELAHAKSDVNLSLIFSIILRSKHTLKVVYLYRFIYLELKPTLICALLWSKPTTLGKAFEIALVAEAQVQNLKETTRLKPNKVEDVKTSMVAIFEEHDQHEYQDNLNEISEEKNDAKPSISTDTFCNNGGNDSETIGMKAPIKEVVDNGIESEVVVGLPGKFQKGDMVDALLRVEKKSSRIGRS
nr:hypothetical protein [Tanacetum cinerariifolium]